MPFRPDIATKIKKCLFLSVAFTGKLSTRIPNNGFPVEHQTENAPPEFKKNASWWNTCQQLHQNGPKKLPVEARQARKRRAAPLHAF